MSDALSESALARGASTSTPSMSDSALGERALARHAITQEQDLERRSRRVQQDRRRRGRDRDARGHQVRGADSRESNGPLGRRVRHHRLRGRDEGRLRQQCHGQRRAGLHGLRSRTESRNTFTPSTTRVVRATHRSFHTEDYYAGFEDAPEWVTVEPAIGKLDRRGGAETTLTVTACPPPGTTFSGELGLVCVLPDDIDKACLSVSPSTPSTRGRHSLVGVHTGLQGHAHGRRRRRDERLRRRLGRRHGLDGVRFHIVIIRWLRNGTRGHKAWFPRPRPSGTRSTDTCPRRRTRRPGR